MADNHNKWAERAFDRQDEREIELMRASINDAKEAIRAAFILNGSACIALLGLLASTMGNDTLNMNDPMLQAAKHGMKWFATGAAMAAITAGLAYLCNSLYAGAAGSVEKTLEYPYLNSTQKTDRMHRWGVRLNLAAVLVVFGSYLTFGVGLYKICAAV